MMKNVVDGLKRYDPRVHDFGDDRKPIGTMEEYSYGEWVRLSDVRRALTRPAPTDAEVEEMWQRLARADGARTNDIYGATAAPSVIERYRRMARAALGVE